MPLTRRSRWSPTECASAWVRDYAATSFVTRLGDRVRSGLRIVGIPTSDATATLAASLGITLGTLDESDDELALTVDGADEVSPDLDLVKGFGGALVRERIVAAASRRQVIVVGHDKLVDRLGTRGQNSDRGRTPFGCSLVLRRVRALGLTPTVRRIDAAPVISANGNLTIDCGLDVPLADAPGGAHARTGAPRHPGRRRHRALSRHSGRRAGRPSGRPRRRAASAALSMDSVVP